MSDLLLFIFIIALVPIIIAMFGVFYFIGIKPEKFKKFTKYFNKNTFILCVIFMNVIICIFFLVEDGILKMENLIMIAIVLFFVTYIIYKKINNDNNAKSIKDKTEEYLKNAIFPKNVLAQNNISENKNIAKVYEHINKNIKPLEKIEVIKNLFVDSMEFVFKNFHIKNGIEVGIIGCELSLHVYALYFANTFSSIRKLEEKEKVETFSKFVMMDMAIKNNLNKIIVDVLGRNPLTKEDVRKIITSRVEQIYKEKDFENRHFNFQNLCNYEIDHIEEENFFDGEISDLNLEFGNPLERMVLPLAYKIGLVDKYLKELEEAF